MLLNEIKNSPHGSKVECLSIYETSVRIRFLEIMADEFPKTKTFLGEKKFNSLSWQYLQQFPSREKSISFIGRNFHKFLFNKKVKHACFLRDLAKLEWENTQLFFDTVPRNFPIQKFEKLDSDTLMKTVLRFDNPYTFLKSSYALDEKTLKPRKKRPVWFLIFNNSQGSQIRRISTAEKKAIEVLGRRYPLEKTLDLLMREIRHFSIDMWQSWLHSWISDELLTSFESLKRRR